MSKDSLNSLKVCPGTLASGFDTYSPTCLKKLFNGRKVSHTLPFPSPNDEQSKESFIENRQRLSISGVQVKASLVLEKNVLRLARDGEPGQYILKPVPYDLIKTGQAPANEHLTMQIASQVFKIKTAENALIFFNDDEPAYITKRFDLNEDGSKKYQEDFTSLGGRTEEIDGKSFKYEGSYQDIAENIIRYIPAHIRELERFFQLVVFNYLFSNGDAHLKNFSILESEDGDPLLSPAYDLISTRIHVKDSDMALKNGLFSDQFTTESYLSNAFYARDDFMEFGMRIGYHHFLDCRWV